MTDLETFTAQIAPWRQRFPALALAELFASAGEAPTLLARTVLLLDACDAAWQVGDARVGMAKLGWWAEQWPAIQSGQGPHPLTPFLKPASASAPFVALWHELSAQGLDDLAARHSAYAAIADEYALAFHAPDSAQFAGFRQLALVLVIGRHVAALWAGRELAVAALPRDWRARHQLGADPAWLVSAPGQQACHAASMAFAESAAAQLRQSASALPSASWTGQRGARVLTALALDELPRLGRSNGLLSRYRSLFRAWQVATATPA